MAKKIKVKLILELLENQVSQREISRTRKISRHSISNVNRIAKELGITYHDVKDKTDNDVYHMFFPDKFSNENMYKLPDYTTVHSELKRTGVNLKLLWQEYKDECNKSDEISMGYSKFCDGYGEHVSKNSLTNHLRHKPGIVCEVDWSGPGLSIVDPATGEVYKVYLFVATLPYSQYSYVEPCLDMKQNTWLKCNVNMFEYFGGSTVRIICDNLKVGVTSHPRQGEIILNEKYEEFGNHYFTAITPAPVRRPKAKASVEGTVGKIATAIIAKLRNQVFYNIDEVKIAVSEKLSAFNDAPFQKREGSRSSVFQEMELSTLRPLPLIPFEIAQWVYGHKVHHDCHVAYKNNRYSVPYKYVSKKVDLKVTDKFIEVYYKSERLCSHKKYPEYVKNKWSTSTEHMPDRFHQAEWDDVRIRNWASTIGVHTSEVINRIFEGVRIKEQGYNSALSVLKLSKAFSNERLEKACEMALEKVHSPRYRNLKAILSSNQDQVYLEKKDKSHKAPDKKTMGYVRGAEFYKRGDK